MWPVQSRHPASNPAPAPGPLHVQSVFVAVRFRLFAPALPHVRHTLQVGEAARYFAMGRFGRMYGGRNSPTLSGHTQEGPTEGHRHAFYLPTDEDGDGRLDHLTIFARHGFTEPELDALGTLGFLTGRWNDAVPSESGLVRLTFVGRLTLGDLQRLPPFAPSRRWRSVTPFVLNRFPKKYRNGAPKLNAAGRQIDGPEDQVWREWAYWQTANPSCPPLLRAVRRPFHTFGRGDRVHWLDFQRRRSTEGRSTNLAFGFDLEFATPVPGPIALGYACHYGLGLFVPAHFFSGASLSGDVPS